jgi:hypothetical protein
MKEGFYIKGIVVLEPINDKEIMAGTMGIVQRQGNTDIVTVEHVTQEGLWWVDGSLITGELSPETKLQRITVLSGNNIFPLKFGHWKKVIKNELLNSSGLYDFEIVPVKFKKGKYARECTDCNSHFLAGKTQSLCFDCCNKNASAILTDTLINKRKSQKIYKLDDVKTIAVQSYELGMLNYPMHKYEVWLNKIVNNYGSNSIKN